MQRVLAASGEILDACLACGGVTGEHGIGVEKIEFDDLAAMGILRTAFNPRKLLPTAGACGLEQKKPG